MKNFTALLGDFGRFILQNPLTVLLIVLLIAGAPVLLDVAFFFLYFIFGLILVGVVAVLIFRWKLRRMQRQMNDQFNSYHQSERQSQGGFWGFNGMGGQSFGGFSGYGESSADHNTEGDVKVHRTQAAPKKKVAKDVGDYIDFEETKDK